MELLELATEFCEPIVSEKTLNHPYLKDKEHFIELMIERNVNGLCAWPKCDHSVNVGDDIPTTPIYCSLKCQREFIFHFDNPEEEEKNENTLPLASIGEIIEKDIDMPPKKITKFSPEQIEGESCRIGPYRHVLEEMEKWIVKVPRKGTTKPTAAQMKFFHYVNQVISVLGVEMKPNANVFHFFVNLDIKNYDIFEEADDKFKQAAAFALYETATGEEMTKQIGQLDFSYNVYNDILAIFDTIPAQIDCK